MTPTARGLIVELFMSTPVGVEIPAWAIVRAGALFGISENNVRVALLRLASERRITAARRGSYRLARAGEELLREISRWRQAEKGVRPWRGAWLAVHCGALPRADRAALRRRERAMRFLGFAELEHDLHVRPDNLTGGVDEVRARLAVLGLPRGASVFVATEFSGEVEARARALWDGTALDRGYREGRAKVEGWLQRAERTPLDVAAREVYFLGGEAVRRVVYDPLLPAPLVDARARSAFFAAARRIAREGHELWRRFLASGA